MENIRGILEFVGALIAFIVGWFAGRPKQSR